MHSHLAVHGDLQCITGLQLQSSLSLVLKQLEMPTLFSPQCSLPTESVNFISSRNVRGTLDILWSCLTILLLCTWTVQHLSVPPQVTPQNKKQWLRRMLFFFRRKLKSMLITVFAPEVVLGKAFSDHVAAHRSKARMEQFAREDGVKWELSHSSRIWAVL